VLPTPEKRCAVAVVGIGDAHEDATGALVVQSEFPWIRRLVHAFRKRRKRCRTAALVERLDLRGRIVIELGAAIPAQGNAIGADRKIIERPLRRRHNAPRTGD
jgi:hypothetical protein